MHEGLMTHGVAAADIDLVARRNGARRERGQSLGNANTYNACPRSGT